MRRVPITFVALALLLSPFLLIIYRLSAFNAVPRDDYAGFLLWIAGNAEGAIPSSPCCYRPLSMVASLPFYFIVTAPRLTDIPAAISSGHLRATCALSALAFAASIAAAMLAGRVGERKGGLIRSEAILAGALLLALIWYAGVTSIDPLAIMLITAGVCVLHRVGWFVALILVSVLANEKVALGTWRSGSRSGACCIAMAARCHGGNGSRRSRASLCTPRS